jgi:hypothetical protein
MKLAFCCSCPACSCFDKLINSRWPVLILWGANAACIIISIVCTASIPNIPLLPRYGAGFWVLPAVACSIFLAHSLLFLIGKRCFEGSDSRTLSFHAGFAAANSLMTALIMIYYAMLGSWICDIMRQTSIECPAALQTAIAFAGLSCVLGILFSLAICLRSLKSNTPNPPADPATPPPPDQQSRPTPAAKAITAAAKVAARPASASAPRDARPPAMEAAETCADGLRRAAAHEIPLASFV